MTHLEQQKTQDAGEGERAKAAIPSIALASGAKPLRDGRHAAQPLRWTPQEAALAAEWTLIRGPGAEPYARALALNFGIGCIPPYRTNQTGPRRPRRRFENHPTSERTRNMIRRTMIQAVACALTIAIALPVAVAAPKVPTTVEEHVALAKQYQDKAATYRAEAKEHRDMAAAYKKSTLNSHAAAHGQKDPKIEKAVKHCETIATAAEKLATENEKAADYHNLRAKELQGK